MLVVVAVAFALGGALLLSSIDGIAGGCLYLRLPHCLRARNACADDNECRGEADGGRSRATRGVKRGGVVCSLVASVAALQLALALAAPTNLPSQADRRISRAADHVGLCVRD